MSDPTVESVKKVIYASLDAAAPSAAMIKLSEKAARARTDVGKAVLPEVELFARLQFGQAIEVWSTILYVDMRKSTLRAIELGAPKTYLTMHALLPALTHVVTQRNGFVVGFRGDGLFAAFGITPQGRQVPEDERGSIVGQTCATGLMMVEAVQKAVNPILEEFDVPGNVKIGVGIDVGYVVITRIGLGMAFDITTYGNAVNRSAKLCGMGHDEVLLTREAKMLVPSGKGGKLNISLHEMGNKVTSDVAWLKSAYDWIRG